MNLSKEDFRAIIYHFFKAGHSREECRAELFRLHGDIAPHQTTINRCYKEFLSGCSTLQGSDDGDDSGETDAETIPPTSTTITTTETVVDAEADADP